MEQCKKLSTATSGVLIKLGKKKCIACYVHNGANLAYDLMCDGDEEGKVEQTLTEANNDVYEDKSPNLID